MKARHVLILTHQLDSFEQTPYYLRSLAYLWREEGHRVTVQRGLGPRIEADLLVLHVDLTLVPEAYLTYARHYPVVINGGTGDISKRAISRYLVQPGDGYAGSVIVKTNLNFKGIREADLGRRKSLFHRAAHRAYWALPWNRRPAPFEYRIYPTPGEVPLPVWSDADLIVEQFRAERQGDDYVARTYHFFGDQEICNVLYSREPIMRPGNIHRREPVATVPEALRRRRAELKFDFGKFDYALIGDEVIVFDTNRTPTAGDVPPEILERRYRQLAKGLGAFLVSL